MKRYTPDPAAVAAAVAARVDTLERRLAQLEDLDKDVTALGRGIADLTAQVRGLAAGPPANGAANGGGIPAQAQPTVAPGGGKNGQPDWLHVSDPGSATALLAGLDEWIHHVLTPLGIELAAGCWPLHPPAVVELLALATEYTAAYAGPKPTPVSEWLARWLPGGMARVQRQLDRCDQERGHLHNGRLYDAAGLGLPDIAVWWADTHGSRPDVVEAFALSPLQ